MKRVTSLISMALLVSACGSTGSSGLSTVAGATVGVPVYQIYGDMSPNLITLAYPVSREVDANNCEFYVNGFGRGEFAHNSAYRQWVESYLSVDADSLVRNQNGRILNVGMYIKYHGLNVHSPSGDGLYLAQETAPAYYRALMMYSQNVHGASIVDVRESVDQVAFFVDVKRSNGGIDRIWLKNGNTDFTMSAIFDGFPTHTDSLGAGGITYVDNGSSSPIFNQKRACTR